jgi:hypothetical protein
MAPAHGLTGRIDNQIRLEADIAAINMSKITKFGMMWDFLRVRKKWWLAPVMLFVLLISMLIVLSESTVLAPFIYSIF